MRTSVSLVCPVNPDHGRPRLVQGSRWDFYCPHADHDGRPKSHPQGPSTPTRKFFTYAEVERGSLEP